ncbi:MAG: class I SAM-dependent methyltransferase, partial [Bdellovibrionota bacterium]
MPRSPNKYVLYERSVQSPDWHVEFFVATYRAHFARYARNLREDFCGTARLACDWVKRNRSNTGVGLDLDPEPLQYGRKHHYSKLSAAQKKRLTLKRQDVLEPTPEKFDLIVACNFSFFIFKQRSTLLRYFRSCRRSLGEKGMLMLEMAGGPGMIGTMKETRTIRMTKNSRFKYIWDQKSFDPITHDATYAIHFELPDGKKLRNLFTYDWRLWTIPEIRELLAEAGFSR